MDRPACGGFTGLGAVGFGADPGMVDDTGSKQQDKKNRKVEVDLIAEAGGRLVPFEVKYQDTAMSGGKLKGLRLFLEERGVQHGYAITQRWEDFGIIQPTSARRGREREKLDAKILSIPAPLACLWLSD